MTKEKYRKSRLKVNLGVLSPFGLVTLIYVLLIAEIMYGVFSARGQGADAAPCVSCSPAQVGGSLNRDDPTGNCYNHQFTVTDHEFQVFPVEHSYDKFKFPEFEDPNNPFPPDHPYKYYRVKTYKYSYKDEDKESFYDSSILEAADCYADGEWQSNVRIVEESHQRRIEHLMHPFRNVEQQSHQGFGSIDVIHTTLAYLNDWLQPEAHPGETAPEMHKTVLHTKHRATVDPNGVWTGLNDSTLTTTTRVNGTDSSSTETSPATYNPHIQGVPQGYVTMPGFTGPELFRSSVMKEIITEEWDYDWDAFPGWDLEDENWPIYTQDDPEQYDEQSNPIQWLEVDPGQRVRQGSIEIELSEEYTEKDLYEDVTRELTDKALQAPADFEGDPTNPATHPQRVHAPSGATMGFAFSNNRATLSMNGIFGRVAIFDPSPRMSYEVRWIDEDGNIQTDRNGFMGTDPVSGRPVRYINLNGNGVLIPKWDSDLEEIKMVEIAIMDVRAKPFASEMPPSIGAPGAREPSLDGFNLNLPVGRNDDGQPAGSIHVSAGDDPLQALDPASILLANNSGDVTVTRGSEGRIRQLLSSDTLIDIEHLDADQFTDSDPDDRSQGAHVPSGYVIRYFSAPDVNATMQGDFYVVNYAEASQTWRVENPTPGVDPVTAIRLTRSDTAGTTVHTYHYNAANLEWVRETDDLQERSWIEEIDDDNRVVHRESLNATTGALLAKNRRIEQKGRYGWRVVADISGVNGAEHWIHYDYIDDDSAAFELPALTTMNHGRVWRKVYSGGRWEYFVYDAFGRVVDIYTGTGDDPPPAPGQPLDPTSCRRTRYEYTTLHDQSYSDRPRLIEEWVDGEQLNWTYLDYEAVDQGVTISGSSETIVARATIGNPTSPGPVMFGLNGSPFSAVPGKQYIIRFVTGALSLDPGAWQMGRYSVVGAGGEMLGISRTFASPQNAILHNLGYDAPITADGGPIGLTLLERPDWEIPIGEATIQNVVDPNFVTTFSTTEPVVPGERYRIYYLDGTVRLNMTQHHLGKYAVVGATDGSQIGNGTGFADPQSVESAFRGGQFDSLGFLDITAESATLGLQLLDHDSIPVETDLGQVVFHSIDSDDPIEFVPGPMNVNAIKRYRVRYESGGIRGIDPGSTVEKGTFNVVDANGFVLATLDESRLEQEFDTGTDTISMQFAGGEPKVLNKLGEINFTEEQLENGELVNFAVMAGQIRPGRRYVIRYKEGAIKAHGNDAVMMGRYSISGGGGESIGRLRSFPSDPFDQEGFMDPVPADLIAEVAADARDENNALRPFADVEITASGTEIGLRFDSGSETYLGRAVVERGGTGVGGEEHRAQLIKEADHVFFFKKSTGEIVEIDGLIGYWDFEDYTQDPAYVNEGLTDRIAVDRAHVYNTNLDPNARHDAFLIGTSAEIDMLAHNGFGRALRCSGGYAHVTNSSSYFNPTQDGFTVSLWFKKAVPITREMVFVSKHQRLTAAGFFMEVIKEGHKDWTQFWLANTPLSNSSYTPGFDMRTVEEEQALWHHLVGVFDGAMTHMYLDGELQSPSKPATHLTDPEVSLANATTVLFGAVTAPDSNYQHFFLDGWLDEIRMYNRPLSTEEVQLLHHAELVNGDLVDRRVVVQNDEAYRIRVAKGAVGDSRHNHWRLGEYTVRNDAGVIGGMKIGEHQLTHPDFATADAYHRGEAWDTPVGVPGDQHIGLRLHLEPTQISDYLHQEVLMTGGEPQWYYHLYELGTDTAKIGNADTPVCFELYELVEAVPDPAPTFSLVELDRYSDNTLGNPPARFQLVRIEDAYADNVSGTPPVTFELVELQGVDVPVVALKTTKRVRSTVPQAQIEVESTTYSRLDERTPGASRISRIDHPDGTATLIAFFGDPLGEHGYTVLTGELNENGDTVISGTQTVTVYTGRGALKERTVTDLDSGIVIARTLKSGFDLEGRATLATYLDGTTASWTYGCCNLDATTDRSGVTTTYSYDQNERVQTMSIDGVTTIYERNPLGRILKRFRQGRNGTVVQLEDHVYDVLGRPLASRRAEAKAPPPGETVSLGHLTEFEYAPTPYDSNAPAPEKLTVTRTNSDNQQTATEITEYHLDGNVHRITGTGVAGVQFSYGSSPGFTHTRRQLLDLAGNATGEWVETYVDGHGNVLKQLYPDSSFSSVHHNDKGQLVFRIDQDGYSSHYVYNELGELDYEFSENDALFGLPESQGPGEAVDLDHDFVLRYDSFVGPSEAFPGENAIIQVTKTYPETGNPALLVPLVRTETLLLRQGHATIHYGNVAGSQKRITRQERDPDGGGWKNTLTRADGTSLVTLENAGKVLTRRALDVNDVVLDERTLGYDEFDRPDSVTDQHGGSMVTKFFPDGSVQWTTQTPHNEDGQNLSPRTTTFGYDGWGNRAVTSIFDGDASVLPGNPPPLATTTRVFDERGHLRSVSGDLTYPAAYTYDHAGRVATLSTWRTEGDESTKATTTWEYDPQRGWPTAKIYSDNRQDNYFRTLAGRFSGWQSAGGRVVNYSYHQDFPQIHWVEIDPDGSGAPEMTFEAGFDRMRRRVIWGPINRSFNLFGQVLTEATAWGGDFHHELRNAYDTIGRRTRLELRDSAAAVFYAADYAYDAAGRLEKVTNGGQRADYKYDAPYGALSRTEYFHANNSTAKTDRLYDGFGRLRKIETLPAGSGLELLETIRIGQVNVAGHNSAFATPVIPGERYRLRYREGAVSLIDGTQWRVGEYDVTGANNERFGDNFRYESPEVVEQFHAGLSLDVHATGTQLGLTLIDLPTAYGDNLLPTTEGHHPPTMELLGVSAPPDPLAAFEYEYNSLDQRTKLIREDGVYWDFGYDARGQLTDAKRRLADDTPSLGQQFEFDFDDIGNRTAARRGGEADGSGLAETVYTPNSVNQIQSRNNPGKLEILGAITQGDPDIFVNFLPAQKQAPEYRRQLDVANDDPVWTKVTTLARETVTVDGVDKDRVTELTGFAYVPPAVEAFSYDDDGNLTADGRWIYRWNVFNRLEEMETHPNAVAAGVPRELIRCEYDPAGRRILKSVHAWNGAGFSPKKRVHFIYDGFNLIAEVSPPSYEDAVEHGANLPAGWELKRSYTWGNDLSGSLHGAGGVGGLLLVTIHARDSQTTAFTAYDGNGNVIGLLDSTSGSFLARYEYGPFGEPIRASGILAQANPFRFSTKYCDGESGLYNYGLRYYNPDAGRWLNRDPIAEQGGLNLYTMLGNDSVNGVDPIGLVDFSLWHNPLLVLDPEAWGTMLYSTFVGEPKVEEFDRNSNYALRQEAGIGTENLVSEDGEQISGAQVVVLIVGAIAVEATIGMVTPGPGGAGKSGCKKGFKSPKTPEDEIALFRKKAGLPTYDGSKGAGAVARLEVNGRKYFGVNTGAQSKSGPVPFKANGNPKRVYRTDAFEEIKKEFPWARNWSDVEFLKHAEAHVLLRAARNGQLPKTVTMHVDKLTCGWCKNQMAPLLRHLGVEELIIYSGGSKTPIKLP